MDCHARTNRAKGTIAAMKSEKTSTSAGAADVAQQGVHSASKKAASKRTASRKKDAPTASTGGKERPTSATATANATAQKTRRGKCVEREVGGDAAQTYKEGDYPQPAPPREWRDPCRTCRSDRLETQIHPRLSERGPAEEDGSGHWIVLAKGSRARLQSKVSTPQRNSRGSVHGGRHRTSGPNRHFHLYKRLDHAIVCTSHLHSA